MSVQAMAWALDARQTGPLSAEARLVLVALADGADPQGRHASFSKTTISARLGVTTRSVQRAMALLREHGLITQGDQRRVEYIRADRRPTVYDLSVDGRQAVLEVDGDEVVESVERYDRDRHGVTPTPIRGETAASPREHDGETAASPREPVDNPSRGDSNGRHGETALSPDPRTTPIEPTLLSSEGDPSARATARRGDLAMAVAPERGRPIGLTDPNCPGCGQPIHRTHHCRASALSPLSPDNAATVRELMLAGPPANAGDQAELALPINPLGECAGCGRIAHLVDGDDLCPRCLVAIARMGPHPLEELA